MRTLTLEDVIIFYKKIIEQTGGRSGIRDLGLIDSALNRAFASYDGQEIYVSVLEKIAVITHALINNHGFIDGNKRIGIAVMLLLLKLNGIKIKYTQKELVELGFGVAAGSIKQDDILNWLQDHIFKES